MPDSSDAPSKRSPLLLNRQRCCLLVVDVQEKLLPAICDADRIRLSITFLMDAAAIMKVPVVISEQYPKGLGPTVSDIADHSVGKQTFEKLRFSAAEGFRKLTDFDLTPSAGRREQVVIVGIEAHICVLQTALDLLHHGFPVCVVNDAIGSRNQADVATALSRICAAGGTVCSAESVVFEWCEDAGTDGFRQISRLVRSRSAKK